MLDVARWRQEFPALGSRPGGQAPIFLDGPGGTQVPRGVVDAMVRYLTTCNANHGGVFATSQESDRIIEAAHQSVADFIHAPAADEIIFGANMTTLTFHLSRAFTKLLRPGDEVMVTRLDHDANVTPWVLAARDAGAVVRWMDIRPEDCTLDLDSFRRQLGPRTRLVAVGAASNAVGTLNDIPTITRLAQEAGALVFVDAVHYAPHGPIDVQAWQCDFLACSAYKFFGPHVGILWGRRQLLEMWPAYKLRPVPDSLPGRWMTGTQNHEGLAGIVAALDYLAGPGKSASRSRFDVLQATMTAIQGYERELSRRLLEGLKARPRFKVWGIADPARCAERVPTVAITVPDVPAVHLAEHLARRHIYAWHGNMYALNLTETLDLENTGGFVRLGMVHYNTAEEIDHLLQVLDEF